MDISPEHVLFFETLSNIITISVLTAYWVYIYRHSKKTLLLWYYLAMHIFAVLTLFGRYMAGISPARIIQTSCLIASHLFMILFFVTLILFLYTLYKENTRPFYLIMTTIFTFLILPLILSFNRILSPFDIFPFTLLFLFTFLFWGAYRLDLLYILPLGIMNALDLMNEGIVVFDGTGTTLYSNKPFRDDFQEIQTLIVNMVKENMKEFSKAKHLPVKKDIECKSSGRIFRLWIRPILSLAKGITGYTCIVHDDTNIVALIRDLEEKNQQLEAMYVSIEKLSRETKKLAILKERNILAKEIHDVLGHSLNYTLHVLESNRIILQDDPKRALKRLREAITYIDEGLNDIASGFMDEQNHFSRYEGFCASMEQMAEMQKDIGVSINITGMEDLRDCSESILKALYRICQEAVTNFIKHGNARNAIISIKKNGNEIILNIVDDGVGCPEVVKGSGLKGMENRIQELGGCIHFSSFEDGSGFQIKASIPLAQPS